MLETPGVIRSLDIPDLEVYAEALKKSGRSVSDWRGVQQDLSRKACHHTEPCRSRGFYTAHRGLHTGYGVPSGFNARFRAPPTADGPKS